MKREEIEQLLAGYASGEISAADSQHLEELFKQDPKLKEEADEMAAVWQSLKNIEELDQPTADMDKRFYTMLQNAKADAPKGARVIQISTSRIKTAAAIAACIAMFVIGRYTVSPVEVVKYKAVFVKQPIINAPQIKPERVFAVTRPANKAVKPQKEIRTNDNNSELARQLRSVFASERIDAVAKLSAQKNLSESDLKLLTLALQEDPNPNIRLTVINSLRPLINRPNVQQVLISGLNRQDDLLVQSSLVDVLVSAKSKQAIPQMITLMDNKNTDAMVQNKIKDGIETFLN